MTEAFRGEPTPPEESKRFWFGPDFITINKFQPVNGTSKILVMPQEGSLPPDGKVRDKSIATKSRDAQWGIEVTQDSVDKIAEETEGIYQTPAEVTVISHTGNKIILPPNTPLFSLYSQGPRIEGKELVEMIGRNRDIDISGKQGKAWDFVYKNPYTQNEEDVIAIAVAIRNDKRWFIPPGTSLDIAALSNAGSDYRLVVDTAYQDVPRDEPVDIYFGEVADLKLSRKVAIEIAKPIVPSLNVAANIIEMEKQRIYPNGRHIGARLLHPGSGLNNPEGRPIRVEIDTIGSFQKPGAVVYYAMRAA